MSDLEGKRKFLSGRPNEVRHKCDSPCGLPLPVNANIPCVAVPCR